MRKSPRSLRQTAPRRAFCGRRARTAERGVGAGARRRANPRLCSERFRPAAAFLARPQRGGPARQDGLPGPVSPALVPRLLQGRKLPAGLGVVRGRGTTFPCDNFTTFKSSQLQVELSPPSRPLLATPKLWASARRPVIPGPGEPVSCDCAYRVPQSTGIHLRKKSKGHDPAWQISCSVRSSLKRNGRTGAGCSWDVPNPPSGLLEPLHSSD